MSINDAFKDFQQTVNANIEEVREARRRRDLFKTSFGGLSDVDEVVPSGSLARGTQKDPIHDVDLVIVYSASDHPGWGQPGDSAEEALDYTRAKVNELLGITNGTDARVVRLARWRNHAVKCFFDDESEQNPFTVDAMPALRFGDHFLVPEATSNAWIECDPEYLIALVAGRHGEWDKFAGSVRMLKRWAADQDTKIKSLVMEVLALEHIPRSVENQPSAIKQFFVAAAYALEGGERVKDPANLCGDIQADLDYSALAVRLRGAADEAEAAIQAQINNDLYSAYVHWGKVFGSSFPKPPAGLAPLPAVVPAAPRKVKDTPQG